MPGSLRAVFLRALLFLSASAALGAPAAGDPTGTDPGGKASDRILTPAQLRECLAQRDRLHAQTDDALKDKAALDADRAEIESSGKALAEQAVTLDRTSAEAVDAYNAKVIEREKLIESLPTRVAAYNAKAETVKTTKDGYEKSCENRRYDQRDLTDLQRKK